MFQHPTISLETPAPGHFVIRGHHPRSVPTDEGLVVPLSECYISPEVPSEALFAVLEARKDYPPLFKTDTETGEASPVDIASFTDEDLIAALKERGCPVTFHNGGINISSEKHIDKTPVGATSDFPEALPEVVEEHDTHDTHKKHGKGRK